MPIFHESKNIDADNLIELSTENTASGCNMTASNVEKSTVEKSTAKISTFKNLRILLQLMMTTLNMRTINTYATLLVDSQQ